MKLKKDNSTKWADHQRIITVETLQATSLHYIVKQQDKMRKGYFTTGIVLKSEILFMLE
jgi:hypothetical protein